MKEISAPDAFVKRGIKINHLRLLAALAEHRQLGAAADAINITQPAASRLLAEVERIVGAPVHERSGRGLQLTAVGEAMARRAQRVTIELRDAAREVENIAKGRAGTVRIGSVTGPAIERVFPALTHLRKSLADVRAEVTVAPSDQLCDQLLDGSLDFAIGRLPVINPHLFDFVPIAGEPLCLLVRRDHPLTKLPNLTAPAALHYDWVMPGANSILTRTVIAGLHRHGLEMPRQALSTTSFLLTLAMVERSEGVAPVAKAVAEHFVAATNGAYVILPLDLGIVVETYGLVTLTGTELPPLAQRFVTLIRNPV